MLLLFTFLLAGWAAAQVIAPSPYPYDPQVPWQTVPRGGASAQIIHNNGPWEYLEVQMLTWPDTALELASMELATSLVFPGSPSNVLRAGSATLLFGGTGVMFTGDFSVSSGFLGVQLDRVWVTGKPVQSVNPLSLVDLPRKWHNLTFNFYTARPVIVKGFNSTTAIMRKDK
jgi:hypothetical protein